MASNGVQDSEVDSLWIQISRFFSASHHMHKSAAMMHKGLLEGRPMMNCQWLAAYFNLLLFTMLSSSLFKRVLRIKCIRNVSSDCVFGTCSDRFGRKSKSLEYWESAENILRGIERVLSIESLLPAWSPKWWFFMKIACKWNLHWKVFIGRWPVGVIVMTACWTSVFNAVHSKQCIEIQLQMYLCRL